MVADLSYGPVAFFGLVDLVLVACILYDAASRRRLHPAFLWGGLLIIASQPLRFALASTSGWLALARWLTA